jgi:uncharacterized lipoprotein YddW (UPF0748 family)
MAQIRILTAFLWLLPAIVFAADENNFPPPPAREFRAAWIATVGNSCWPSKPGLSTAKQKAELIAMLDRAVALKLNAVIFQVRPACDAFYESSFEPWSEYLTGVQGRPPYPFYDPLAFGIAEAHKRGLELHAWFNPFRVRNIQILSPAAPNHVSKTHPQFVRSYGKYLWLDPGDPAARDYSERVIMDVVKRYDVDGVHCDDYFYPYAETNSAGKKIDFPDAATWKKFGASSGLTRDDWRRSNANAFIEQIYHAIKAEKPWVKFGIAPFGIWRPKNPPSVSGFDAYAELYCDSRLWLREGWCDYLAPQLYWSIDSKKQSFPALLDWWENENPLHRHIWPGMNTLNAGGKWPSSEIINEINVARRFPEPGEIHWNIAALMKNYPLDIALQQESYRQPALIPASPWLDATRPAKPNLENAENYAGWKFQWDNNAGAKPARWWLLQSCVGTVWTTEILPEGQFARTFAAGRPDVVSLRAVDRTGNLSAPAIWTPKK